MFWVLVTALFLLLYALLISYYWKGWKKDPVYQPTGHLQKHFISVIVPARNEEKNLPVLLQALSGQSYPVEMFEIIVVDDYSSDSTAERVNDQSMQNVSLVRPAVAPQLSSKKKSIEAGIHKAVGELIVTTDADCIPPAGWLDAINDFYVSRHAAFIAAPVKFVYDKSLLQVFQALDFLTLQGITAASVSLDFHMMCNGANLAYKKEAFEKVKGFDGIDQVATGDDMLLMYKIRRSYPGSIFYLKSRDAMMTTQPMLTWRDFLMQRKRWASKTLVYDDWRIIAVLTFVYLLNCLFPALLIASFFDPEYWWIAAGFLFFKALIEYPFVRAVAEFYGERKLMGFLWLFQPLHCLYTVSVGLVSQLGKYEWKGRRTK